MVIDAGAATVGPPLHLHCWNQITQLDIDPHVVNVGVALRGHPSFYHARALVIY